MLNNINREILLSISHCLRDSPSSYVQCTYVQCTYVQCTYVQKCVMILNLKIPFLQMYSEMILGSVAVTHHTGNFKLHALGKLLNW